jgi:hypothetical protein
LIVSDSYQHRVLIWNSFPTANAQPADLVLGQADFVSAAANQGGGVSAATMNNPTGVFYDGTRLFVADTLNYRVLVWNAFPTANGQAADLILGQPDGATNNWSNGNVNAQVIAYPIGIDGNGTRLFVSDCVGNRVLVWKTIPTATFQAADMALGQQDLTSKTPSASSTRLNCPQYIQLLGSRLFVADEANSRIVVLEVPQ